MWCPAVRSHPVKYISKAKNAFPYSILWLFSRENPLCLKSSLLHFLSTSYKASSAKKTLPKSHFLTVLKPRRNSSKSHHPAISFGPGLNFTDESYLAKEIVLNSNFCCLLFILSLLLCRIMLNFSLNRCKSYHIIYSNRLSLPESFSEGQLMVLTILQMQCNLYRSGTLFIHCVLRIYRYEERLLSRVIGS